MKTVYFRKICSYDPTFGGTISKFEGMRQIHQLLDDNKVPINCSNFDEPNNYELVIHSKTYRSQKTVEYLRADAKILSKNYLNEFKIPLDAMFMKEVNSKKVREYIVDELKTNPKFQAEVNEEYKQLIADIKAAKAEKILVISHSFRLKVVQCLLETGDLSKIGEYIKPNRKTYEFGTGFNAAFEV